jgi:hypothetical protein
MDKVNSPVGWWLRAISWVPDDGAVVQPSQNAVEPADSSFSDACRYSVYEAYATRQTASAECWVWRPAPGHPRRGLARRGWPQEDQTDR